MAVDTQQGGYMVKKSILIIGTLMMLALAGCKDKEHDNLFKQEQEEPLFSKEEEPLLSKEEEPLISIEEEALLSKEEESLLTDNEDGINNLITPTRGVENTIEIYSTIINEAGEVMANQKEPLFTYEPITEDIKTRIVGKSYGVDCDVPFEELRYVKVLYWGFDGESHTGELIVNQAIAEDIVAIFEELYQQSYPIEKMVLVDEYDADDNASMTDNNTSAFNYRKVDGTDRLSLHSYGLAIDINPLYNPYVRTIDGKTVVTPENGAIYEDRSSFCDYYIDTEDACYKAFTKRGFTWGGEWKNSKDYQHFQKTLE